MLDKILTRCRQWLWAEQSPFPSLTLLRLAARYAWVIGGELLDGQLNMRAMSLVYTTLLSVVPLLALAFSVLKAFGVHNMLTPMLLQVLAPMGAQADVLTLQIVGFVDKIQVGLLGSVGLLLLFYSAISLIHKVEGSFNYIWRITRPRPMAQRMGEYVSVLLIGPVLMFSAIGLTASVFSSRYAMAITRVEPFGFLTYLGSQMLPYVLIIGAFVFMYAFIPNQRVKLRAALIGGVIAGLAWQTASLAFASFVSRSTNYNAIYSGFAIVIFLLIWIYVGWLILLVGCLLTYYIQHPEKVEPQRAPVTPAGRQIEQVTLLAMVLSARRFMHGEQGYTPEELTLALGAQPEVVGRVIECLLHHGLLVESGVERTRLLVARDPSNLPMSQVWRAAREGRGAPLLSSGDDARELAALIERAEHGFAEEVGGLSLREWLAREPPPTAKTRLARMS